MEKVVKILGLGIRKICAKSHDNRSSRLVTIMRNLDARPNARLKDEIAVRSINYRIDEGISYTEYPYINRSR